jgi:PAS domain S-box-containing protein
MTEKTTTPPLSTEYQNKTEGTEASIKERKGRKSLRESNNKIKLLLVLFSVVAYFAAFILLYYTIDYGMGIVAVIPVIVVAWLYGAIPGTCVAVLIFLSNIFLREYLGQEWIQEIVTQGAGILGTLGNMLIGLIVGRMSDLSIQIRKKLYAQEQAEEKLLEYRNHLEDLVKERTEKLKQEVTEHKQSEEKLRETKDHLDNIIDSSLDCVVITDNKGNIARVNQSFLELLGYREEEVTGRHTTELSPSEEGTYESTVGGMVEINEIFFKEATKMHSTLLEEGKIKNWKRYLIRKDQKIVPIEINTVFLYNSEGDFSGSVGILRDITEREKTEKEISESRDFLENIFRTSADAIIITGRNSIITLANEALEKMLGYSKGELIGKSAEELTPKGEKHIEEGKKFIRELLERGVVTNFNRAWLKKDGSLVEVETSAALLKDTGGAITGAVASIRDITERKKTEEELTKTKDHLNDIIESSLDAILVSDETGHISRANKYFQEMLGFTEEELLGKHVTELTLMNELHAYESTSGEMVTIDENYVNDAWTNIYKLHEEGKISNWESYYFRKDKKVVPVEQNIVHLFDTTGERTGSVAIIRDITGRKKMEQQLLQSKKLQSLGELAGGVAHDFNNVLAAVLGRVQLLKTQIKPPRGKQEKRKSMLDLLAGLEIIEKASLDGAETVRRIQKFSRRRVDDSDFVQVDINELIDNALEFTKVRWRNEAESKGIAIKIQKEFSPLIHTTGSPSELREVFTNLVNNAIDAMPQGGKIRIKTIRDNGLAVIKIEDTGSGISNDAKDRIFDPFFTTKGVQSTGLGLSVSYGIVNRHQGAITADSLEGEGTTFTVKLPITEKSGTGKVAKEKAMPIKRGQKKARILVIEDEEDVRNLLRDMLSDAGHKVELANNGSEGIKLFKKNEFDLVFTDLGMPVMSGWEVAEKVKSINGNVPVVLVTGWNITLDGKEMNDKGINLIIQKPFKMGQVLNLVQEGMILRKQIKAV